MSSARPDSTTTERRSKRLICHTSNQGNSLLEECSCSDSALHFNTKEVTFSEYSQLRLYNTNRSHESKKSYSTADTRSFRAQAALDVTRIRNRICPYLQHTVHDIDSAMDLGQIKHEELVGIEHLLSEKAAANLAHERMAHVGSVLRAQQLMQEKYGIKVDTVMLAKIAIRLSSKSCKKARARATWSIIDGNATHASSTMRLDTDKKPEI
jgi:hypothetical protein